MAKLVARKLRVGDTVSYTRPTGTSRIARVVSLTPLTVYDPWEGSRWHPKRSECKRSSGMPAGFVNQKANPHMAGETLTVIKIEEDKYDVVCNAHSKTAHREKLSEARATCRTPEQFCEGCREAQSANLYPQGTARGERRGEYTKSLLERRLREWDIEGEDTQVLRGQLCGYWITRRSANRFEFVEQKKTRTLREAIEFIWASLQKAEVSK